MYLRTYQRIYLFVLLLHFQSFDQRLLSTGQNLSETLLLSERLSSFYSILLVSLFHNLIFLLISPSSAGVEAVNPNGINTLVINNMSTFFIKAKTTFGNGRHFLPRNLLNFIIVNIWVFDNFMSCDELFPEALQRLATYLLVNNELCGKLFLLASILSDDNIRVTTAWKVSKYGGYFWSVFSCIWTEDGDLLRKSRIQCEYRKIRTRITPYLDTFHEE